MNELILFLNKTLANLFVLKMKLYRYDWFIKGEQSFNLKQRLRHYRQIMEQNIDELVDQILFLDGKPFATMVKFIKVTTLEEASADDETIEIIQQIKQDLLQLIEACRKKGTTLCIKNDDHLTLHVLLQLQVDLRRIVNECNQYDVKQ